MRDPVTIDCQYLKPRLAAAYLVVEGKRAMFVETNTTHAVPHLLDALAAAGRRPEDVEYVVITHVHLDHAGGSSALMSACPNATLLAHPRAATHVIDPTRLVAAARHVYGDVQFDRLYGRIDAIPAARVRQMQDGEELRFGARNLKFIHTRGHANHHFVVVDDGSDSVFTGDAFGLRYPDLQRAGLFIFPSTSPTDFDPAEAHKAIDRIVETGSSTAYLTHFGGVSTLTEAAIQLHAYLDEAERIVDDSVKSDVPDENLKTRIESALRELFDRLTLKLQPTGEERALLELDIDLNSQGMAHLAKKRRHPK